MKMTGAQILLECLLEQGVDTVFGYPGGTILNVYDALYDYHDKITHILTAHEQGAAHAADGYARSTGKVGVCFATSGPGATNLTTGIATAYMDSSPVVFISCNVAQSLIGKDAFQEVDITGITMPITKFTYMVRDVEKLADVVRDSFALARSGRPGPVFIDITRDVTAAECDYEPLPLEQHATTGHLASLYRRAYTSSLKMPEADLDDVNTLVEMIAQSEKPMLICGGGVVRSRAHEEFRAFARRIDSPCAITVMGGGGVAGRDPLATGMIGMHGSVASNMAVDNCDLLIAVGCRFSDRVALKPDTFARQMSRPTTTSSATPSRCCACCSSACRSMSTRRGRTMCSPSPPRRGTPRRPAPSRRSRCSPPSCAASRRIPSSQPTSASTRCGRSSTCTSTIPVSC